MSGVCLRLVMGGCRISARAALTAGGMARSLNSRSASNAIGPTVGALNLSGQTPGASHYKEEPMSTTGIEPRPTWHRAVALMQEDMGSDNLSPTATTEYGSAVAAFMAWAVMEGFAIGDVSPDDISRYMEYCREQGFSPPSAGRRLTAIRTLYRSQLSHGQVQSNPAERHGPPVCRAPRGSRGAMSTEWANFIEDYFRDKRHLGRINSEETVRTCRRVLGLHAQDTLSGPAPGFPGGRLHRTLARWEHPNTTRARAHGPRRAFMTGC